MTKKFIKFTTEGKKWTGHVAELKEEFNDRESSGVDMYAFWGGDSYVRFVPKCETELITEQQYFKEILQGARKFDDEG